jgi:glutamate dehydrogenase (NAD(P)+)
MAWIFDTFSMNQGYSVLSVVTGKPLAVGGSLGREEATGRGVFFNLQETIARQRLSLQGLSIAIQGFGNVGGVFAKFAAEAGAKVVAISDSSGGVANGAGLDIPGALAHTAAGGRLAEFPAGDRLTNAELLALPCDVLAPCAMELVLTEANAGAVEAKIVLEGANGPTTPAADAILEGNGVLVVPDVLANAGGVIVSYFEWVQGLQELFWTEPEVNERLQAIVRRAFEETWALHDSRGLPMRMAAYGIGVRRVAEATTIRGLYP